MNRVARRSLVVLIFVLALLAGVIFFSIEFVIHGDSWATFQGSPHVYNGSNINCGVILDRTGVELLDLTDGRDYSNDASLRKATIHWLGDRDGYISAPAVAYHAKAMAGFDTFNGIYAYGDAVGKASLTISSKIQKAAQEAMGSHKGTVAVYNYKTGEILCAVTTPTYDPDNEPDIKADTTGAYNGVYVNRFIQSAYVPGSIFKVVTTAAALDCVEGIEEMTFTCKSRREYGTEAVTCKKAHGTQNLKQALANSCNCAFSQIADLVGKKNMVAYVKKFGITEPMSFDGITTARGNYDISDAAPVSFAWSCIGQYTDLINPAQYMTFMGAIANGGSAAKPYLVSLVQGGGEITYQAKSSEIGTVMSPEIAGILTEYMRNNVIQTYGADRFPDVKVCGKSGTSELGGDLESNAMFAGFVADDRYPLAFVCVVEGGGAGAKTCVPVLNKVLKACMAVLDGNA